MHPLLRCVVYLCPPTGPALALKDGETWIGRGTFQLSEKGQSICSRKQARLKHANSTVQLESHGLNPIFFVVCRSLGFQATDASLSNLRMLKKGEVAELTDGDQFYLAPKECLITVGIKPMKAGPHETAVNGTKESGDWIVPNATLLPISPAVPPSSPAKCVEEVVVHDSDRLIQTDAPEEPEKLVLHDSARVIQADAPAEPIASEGQVPSTDNCSGKNTHALDSTCPNMIKTNGAAQGSACVSKAVAPVESGDARSESRSATDAVILAGGTIVHGEDSEPNIRVEEKYRMEVGQPDTRTCHSELSGASKWMDIGLANEAATQIPSTDNCSGKDTHALDSTGPDLIKSNGAAQGSACVSQAMDAGSGSHTDIDAVILAGGVILCGDDCEPNILAEEKNRMEAVQPTTRTCHSDLSGPSNRMDTDLEDEEAKQIPSTDNRSGKITHALDSTCPNMIKTNGAAQGSACVPKAVVPVESGNAGSGSLEGEEAKQIPSPDNRSGTITHALDSTCPNMIKTNAAQASACVPKAVLPVVSGNAGSVRHSASDAGNPSGGIIVHREDRESSVRIEERNRIEAGQPDTRTCHLDMSGPSNRMEVGLDDEAANLAGSATGLTSYALPEQNNTGDNISANISRIASKDDSPQDLHPCDSGTLLHKVREHIARPLSYPYSDSDVAGVVPTRTSALQEMPEKCGTSQVTSFLAPGILRKNTNHDCRGLPINLDEYKIPDDGNEHLTQQGIFNLSASDNEEQMEERPTDMGFTKNHEEGALKGMENVIATVSGYDNLPRARLINLINLTGAAYTGSLTKSNTHVVCWKLKGPKYAMAVKYSMFVVNHLWFEDCLKAGKRIPENRYTASGDSVAPLHWGHPRVWHRSSDDAHQDDRHGDPPCPNRRSQSLLQPVSAAAETPTGLNGRTPQRFVRNASSSRFGLGDLNRGKAHLQVSCSALGERNGQWLRQDERFARASDSRESASSPPPCGPEQNSDDFWNEVINTCEKGKQVSDKCGQILSETPNNPQLNYSGEDRAGNSNPPCAGSSRDPYPGNMNDEVICIGEYPTANGARALGNADNRRLHKTIPSNSPVREDTSNSYSDERLERSHPKVFLRKRKHSSGMLAGKGTGNHQGSVPEHGMLERLGQPSEQVEDLAVLKYSRNRKRRARAPTVNIEESSSDDEAILLAAPTHQESSLENLEDECQQVDGVADTQTGTPTKLERSSESITCVICHSETKLVIEGVLTCGHKFCYPCIQRWADEAKANLPTCPLCKVPFDFITYREMDKAGVDESGCPVLEERIVEVGQDIPRPEIRCTNLPSLRTESVCITCGSRDTSELLLICTNCRARACHTFCLDPPRPPGSSWFCSRCLQMQSRVQTREAYGRLFQGRSPPSSRWRRSEIPNVVIQNDLTGRFGATVFPSEQNARTRLRRGRQHSLYNYLVRNLDE